MRWVSEAHAYVSDGRLCRQPAFMDPGGNLAARLQRQLALDVADMLLHRPLAQHQGGADDAIGKSLPHHKLNVPLAPRQATEFARGLPTARACPRPRRTH